MTHKPIAIQIAIYDIDTSINKSMKNSNKYFIDMSNLLRLRWLKKLNCSCIIQFKIGLEIALSQSTLSVYLIKISV